MTVGEYIEQQQRRREQPHECGNCADMPRCWLADRTLDFDTTGKECWKPRPVPSYIKNLEMK